MYELIQLTEQTYYIKSPANIGLVRLEGQEVCLIDSGSDKDAGRKVRQILDRNGWTLKAIYNTHAHADHIGGNRYLQGQTGCRIYAPGIDCAFTRYPILEPSLLYGGYPPKDLRHKFLMAQDSGAEVLTAEALPEGFESIPLPGHFFDMVGFRTADDVVFLADCLSSREILEKYQVDVRPRPRRGSGGRGGPGPVQHRQGAGGGGKDFGAVPGAPVLRGDFAGAVCGLCNEDGLPAVCAGGQHPPVVPGLAEGRRPSAGGLCG